MPHYCIVPLCNNWSGTPDISFYHLPLKDPDLLKQWLVKIRRQYVPLTRHSRVCSEHFEGGRKRGKKDVPTVFTWTKPGSCPPPKDCSLQVQEISCKSSTTSISASNTLPESPQPNALILDPIIEGK